MDAIDWFVRVYIVTVRMLKSVRVFSCKGLLTSCIHRLLYAVHQQPYIAPGIETDWWGRLRRDGSVSL